MQGTSAADMNKEPQRPGRPAWRFLPLAILLAGLTLGYSLGWHEFLTLATIAESRDALKAMVAEDQALSAATFFLVYTLAVAFSFPAASVLSVLAGFLFGWLAATVLVVCAATLGATALFLTARSACGDFLRRKISGKAAALAEGFEKDAFSYLLVLRLTPVVPFFLLNIAPALFNVSLRTYVLATLIGILPGTLAYCWLGEGLDSVIAAADAAGREPSLGDLATPQITVAFVALALVAALPLVVRKLRDRAGR